MMSTFASRLLVAQRKQKLQRRPKDWYRRTRHKQSNVKKPANNDSGCDGASTKTFTLDIFDKDIKDGIRSLKLTERERSYDVMKGVMVLKFTFSKGVCFAGFWVLSMRSVFYGMWCECIDNDFCQC